MLLQELLIEADYDDFNAEPVDEVKTREFRIPIENLDKLEHDVAKLNKRAAKLGSAPIKLIMGERKMEEVKKGHVDWTDEMRDEIWNGKQYKEYQYLTVEGEAPKLNGWTFVGKLEDLNGETIVKAIPGMKVPRKYHNAPIHCEHCKKKVRRNDTFIVKKGKATYKQVGRSCLKDFLGHADPSFVASMAELMKDLDGKMSDYENEGYGGRPEYTFDVKEVLETAFAVIRDDKGFRPKSFNRPTSAHMIDEYFPPKPQNGYRYEHVARSPQDKVDAEAAINWINSKEKDKSDFIQNLIKIVRAGHIKTNYFGFVAALAGMFLKERDKIVHTPKGDNISDEEIAPIGTKVKFQATVISAFQYQGNSFSYYDNGVRKVLTIKTDDNKLLKMFTAHLEIEKGDRVEISGKIGKHEAETYDKSPFKGHMVTMMAPKARIVQMNAPAQPQTGADPYDGVVSVQGKPVPPTIVAIKQNHSQSDQWHVALDITPESGNTFTKKYKWDEVQFKDQK